jgi:hypothetical protein
MSIFLAVDDDVLGIVVTRKAAAEESQGASIFAPAAATIKLTACEKEWNVATSSDGLTVIDLSGIPSPLTR